jgi:hypothetical protein
MQGQDLRRSVPIALPEDRPGRKGLQHVGDRRCRPGSDR